MTHSNGHNWRAYHSPLLGEGLGVRLYFPYLCNAISVTLPRKMPLVTLLLDADYTVI